MHGCKGEDRRGPLLHWNIYCSASMHPLLERPHASPFKYLLFGVDVSVAETWYPLLPSMAHPSVAETEAVCRHGCCVAGAGRYDC